MAQKRTRSRKEPKRIYVHVDAERMLKSVMREQRCVYLTSMFEKILTEFLDDPKGYDFLADMDSDGPKKYIDVRLDPNLIEEIQEVADTYFNENFSLLVRQIVKAWAAVNNYTIEWNGVEP